MNNKLKLTKCNIRQVFIFILIGILISCFIYILQVPDDKDVENYKNFKDLTYKLDSILKSQNNKNADKKETYQDETGDQESNPQTTQPNLLETQQDIDVKEKILTNIEKYINDIYKKNYSNINQFIENHTILENLSDKITNYNHKLESLLNVKKNYNTNGEISFI